MTDFLSYMTCTSWIISVLETCSSAEPIKSAIKHCQIFNKAAGKYVLVLHTVAPVQNNINGYDYYQESIMTKPRPRNDDDRQFTSVETIERLQQNGIDISALYDRGVIPPMKEIVSEEEDCYDIS